MAASKGRFAALQAILTGAMGQHPMRVGAFLGAIDDATAARLLAAAESGDTRPLLKAMAEQTWGTAPARQAPPAAEPPASRDPVSFRDRIANEPKVREGLEDAGVSTEGMTQPQMLKEYVRTVRGSAAPRGRPRSAEESIRELVAPSVPASPTRQIELPFASDEAFDGAKSAYQRMADGQSVIRRGEIPDDQYADLAHADLMRQPFVSQPPLGRYADDASPRPDYMFSDEVHPSVSARKPPEWSDEARAASAIAAGTGAAIGLDALATGLAGGGNPADLRDDPVSGSDVTWDMYDRPDPFEPVPPDQIKAGNRYFHQDFFDYQPFGGVKESAIGQRLPPAKAVTPKQRTPARESIKAAPPKLVGLPKDTGRQPAESTKPLRPTPAAPVVSAPVTKKPDWSRAADNAAMARRWAAEDLGALDQSSLEHLATHVNDMPYTWAKNNFDGAKAIIDEYNRRRDPAVRPMRNRFRESDELDAADLTESGNPAELSPTPVAVSPSQPSAPAQPTEATQYYQQAIAIMDQLNQMYRDGMSPHHPEARRLMSQFRQLRAQGDAIRNRRAG